MGKRQSRSIAGWPGKIRAGGYFHIVGEMEKLGVVVSATAVRGVLRCHGLGPAPRRSGLSLPEFIQGQAKRILATDFFHIDTVFGQRFYGLFVIEVEPERCAFWESRRTPTLPG
jgi:putative transposase